ncbi:protein anon-73B1 isoform X2 [Melanaphis sacchari]|nr:protein anon-73B1 isoform X2 [Melanaphis sacchari]XP_025197766.1 protein anon-73B1 isoform X2 [Melanaphis sacchari]XP_025197767.1 protein anon-73B1 isoform X2 [Melanaphis sacchari]
MFPIEESDEVFDAVIRYGLYLVAIFQLVCITTVFLLTDQSNDSKDNGDGSEYDSDGSTFASPRRPYSHHRSRKQDKKKRR